MMLYVYIYIYMYIYIYREREREREREMKFIYRFIYGLYMGLCHLLTVKKPQVGPRSDINPGYEVARRASHVPSGSI